MDWDLLKMFYEVAESGSFSEAGRRLNMNQSSISRQVGNLEYQLNVPLFYRHSKGLSLTDQGNTLFMTVDEIINKLKSVETRLSDTKDKPFGEIIINSAVGLGSFWLSRNLDEFNDFYPDIKLTIKLTDNELNLSAGEAHVALRVHPQSQPNLIQRKLFTVRQHLYASPKYLRKYGTPRTIEDLDSHKLLSYGEAPSFLSSIDWHLTCNRPKNKPRNAIISIDNLLGLKQAALNGIGIVSLPDYIVREDSRLVQVFSEIEAPNFEAFMVFPEEMRNSKRIRVFCDFIYAKAKNWQI